MILNLRTVTLISLLLLANTNVLAKTYIFVSFSMPDSALKSYFTEAKKLGAILVMRGLKNNSFLETKAKTDELSISFNIDPNLFKQYQITSVPTIIVDNDHKEVKKLTDHISLHDGLEIMQKEN